MDQKDKFGRRTWDRDEYAKLAKEGKAASHLSDTTADQLAQLKGKYTDHFKLIQDSTRDADKRVLTAALTSYKKGKQFGFYCDLCNMTFKDTLQYVDHLNHKSHQLCFERIFGESLIFDQRDNDELSAEELAKEYKLQMLLFLKDHAKVKPMKHKSSRKKAKQTPEASDTGTIEVTKAMGFSSFIIRKN